MPERAAAGAGARARRRRRRHRRRQPCAPAARRRPARQRVRRLRPRQLRVLHAGWPRRGHRRAEGHRDRPRHRLVRIQPGRDPATACPARSTATRPRRRRTRGTGCAVAPASHPEVDYRSWPTTSSDCSTRTPRSSASPGAAHRTSRRVAVDVGEGQIDQRPGLGHRRARSSYLIHGGAQNAHTWDTVALALDRPLVALDLPGHGHSSHRAGSRVLARARTPSRSTRRCASSRRTRGSSSACRSAG